MEISNITSIVAIIISIGSLFLGYGMLKQKVAYAEERDRQQDKAFEAYKTYIGKKIDNIEKHINQATPALEHFSKIENELLNRLRLLEQVSTQNQEKISQAITLIEADKRYVGKEEFSRFEKHIDDKFEYVNTEIQHIRENVREVRNDTKKILSILSKGV